MPSNIMRAPPKTSKPVSVCRKPSVRSISSPTPYRVSASLLKLDVQLVLLIAQLIDPKQADSSEPKTPKRFSLHLNLEPLGNIEILFLDTSEGLYIRFCCDTNAKSLFANSHQDELKKMVSSTNILAVSFGEDAGNPAQELIQQLIPDGETMLDTKIDRLRQQYIFSTHCCRPEIGPQQP